MPTYNFECSECGMFEDLVPMGTKSIKCKCGKTANKVFAATLGIAMGITNNDKKIQDKIKNDTRSPSSGVTFDNGRAITG